MTRRVCFLNVLVAVLLMALSRTAFAEPSTIDLKGTWGFRLDPDKKGADEHWHDSALPDKTKLPGSTDENHYGTPNTRKADFNYLSREVEYTGAAWYQRKVTIPPEWAGKRVVLFLERCHWESQVWVDGHPVGMRDSLSVPHVYALSKLMTPGEHTLTVRVDNTLKYDLGKDAHSVSEQTQTNWNGIIGRIELRATDPVWIDSAQVYPDVENKRARVRLVLGNETGKATSGAVSISASKRDGTALGPVQSSPVSLPEKMSECEVTLPLGDTPPLWNEFSPALYDVTVSLTGKSDGVDCHEIYKTALGFRSLTARSRQLLLNGNPIFLRGTLECCVFPLTGYPPMDVDSWLREIRIAKSYGLNQLRFHSWCPPEAAFAAADQEGFLLYVEAPQWVADIGKAPARDRFVEEEVTRILDSYGNHASFGFLSMGNELRGDEAQFKRLVETAKAHDPRRLYASSTAWSHCPHDQFNVTSGCRGLHGPSTDADFREFDAKQTPLPVISHEIGQWTVFPNLSEVSKYTGVLKPRNFELVRQKLEANHLLDQAADFTRASGKLMTLLYKEEIESQLRTPGHAGFQLLDLHDFPGQGTALVGILDPFWDSKGLIAPEEFRRFCGPTVPLLRMSKRTYTTDETFKATADIFHYGPAPLQNARPEWSLRDEGGKILASGSLPTQTITAGQLSPLGAVAIPLAEVPAPSRLTVTVGLKDTAFSNEWNIWVYPTERPAPMPSDIVVATAWDDKVTAALDAGQKVLLLASSGILRNSRVGSFTPVFWSPVWFTRGAGTMSILCDPKHPALAGFPTDSYTDWQWYDLLQNSASMYLNDLPTELRPIVQVIDNFSRDNKYGNVFEAKVGAGRLMVCSIELQRDLDKRPAARQLLRSLVAYMSSERFQPPCSIGKEALAKFFPGAEPLVGMMRAPKPDEKAVLHVVAAGKAPKADVSLPWSQDIDRIVTREPEFNYDIKGAAWRDETGTAWHDSDNLEVRVTCPKGFAGTLYVHLHDWNNENRVAEISFQTQQLGTLDSYGGPGVWLAVPVTAQASATGVVTFSAHPTHSNAMITEIELTK